MAQDFWQEHLGPKFGEEVAVKGREIFALAREQEGSLFDKAYWSGKMMDWSMKNEAFKVEMFRFVDVLPSLQSSDQILDHMKQYFFRPGLETPAFIKTALGLAGATGLTAKMAAASVRKNVESMASTFITGQDSESAKKALEKLWNEGFAFTVDILGEAVVSETEAAEYQKKYLELVAGLPLIARGWKTQEHLENSVHGDIPRINVSVKCSSLFSQIDNFAFRKSVEQIKERLRPILDEAIKHNVFINLDMEQNDLRELFLTVADELFCEKAYAGYPHIGIVIQAYLKCASSDIERILRLATKRGTPLTVRLVKGAYWDFEVISSLQKNLEIPVFTDKDQTDANYERCTWQLLKAYPHVHAAFGSHNVRSLAVAMVAAEKLGLAKSAFEIQMLYGMAGGFKRAVKALGYRIREYAPVGQMLPGMAYLVRRLLENTSNEGFLRAKAVGIDSDALLVDPSQKPAKEMRKALSESGLQFQNAAMIDLAVPSERAAIEKALANVQAKLPMTVTPIVAGVALSDSRKDVKNSDPSDKARLVSVAKLGTIEDAETAILSCEKAQKTWAARSVSDRVAVLNKAAELMSAQKHELSALMVYEVGKSVREADADVAEAIDFCRYYAESMQSLAGGKAILSKPGERNDYLFRARGPAVVIAPWNFPLAILCGMAVGPLVAGNTVILKPAEQSPAIAKRLYDILIEAGVPSDVVHLLPGLGETVGQYLVSHPKVHIINFTGSRAVGLKIIEEAAKVKNGMKHVKKVLAEMGGKNALIIDEDADLDEAVVGILHSAFGFQGQKCSALSRLIVLESCYEKLKTRLADALASIKVGAAWDPSSKIGPVVDADSQQRLLGVIERNKNKIIAQIGLDAELLSRGFFVPPTIFEESDPLSELGQNEFFGPLLCLFKVKTLDEAFAMANNVDYALTGGIYSRNPESLRRAREELEVGNLYINRGITGALVGRQPFGGYKLSGVGAKAGGPDYLLQFLEPVTQTENTMRRGFAPEI